MGLGFRVHRDIAGGLQLGASGSRSPSKAQTSAYELLDPMYGLCPESPPLNTEPLTPRISRPWEGHSSVEGIIWRGQHRSARM